MYTYPILFSHHPPGERRPHTRKQKIFLTKRRIFFSPVSDCVIEFRPPYPFHSIISESVVKETICEPKSCTVYQEVYQLPNDFRQHSNPRSKDMLCLDESPREKCWWQRGCMENGTMTSNNINFDYYTHITSQATHSFPFSKDIKVI